jgi:hypothetical protein
MILVYKYGLAAPHQEFDRIVDQMRCAHRYRNTLVEIERGRRAAERAMVTAHAPALAALMEAAELAERDVAAAVQEIRRERARTRKRSESKDVKDRLRLAKEVKSACVGAVRQARKDLRDSPVVQAERDRISELALSLVRDGRAISGLARRGPHVGAWGTYQLVEESAQASFASVPLYEPDGVTPSDPLFLRWTGEGAVSVQVQGGVPAADVMLLRDQVGHPQIRITPPDERAWIKMPGNGRADRRRYARRGALELCLGTDIEGNRIYGHWRLDMHRAIPDKAVIKRATVHCRRSGPHSFWSLELTLECPDRPVIEPTHGGAVAIDIGWRVMGAELRIAGWADVHGRSGDWRLDAKVLRALHEPEEIRSMRAARFNVEILRLAAWIDILPAVSEWLGDTSSLRLWKSPARLVYLRNRWRAAREEGLRVSTGASEDIAYAALDAWASNDTQYWGQESVRRDASLRRRRDQYRFIAARLCEEYETIVLEQFDLRVFAKRGAVDDGPENDTARSNRHLAAVSELRICIINAARGSGRVVVAMPAHDTTRTCPTCGLVADRPAAPSIMLTCECGATWDQDVAGASETLLIRWRERPGDAKILAGARTTGKDSDSEDKEESRRERVTRMRKEKEARMRDARGPAPADSE